MVKVRDDIVLVRKFREEINRKLEMWRQTLEAHDFLLIRSMIKYMKCKFSKRCYNHSFEVKVGENILPLVTEF